MHDKHENREIVETIGAMMTASWRSVERNVIETCLSQSANYDALPTSDQREVLLALVHLELELRRKLGQSPTISEYATRFPTIGREVIEELITLPAAPPSNIERMRRPLTQSKRTKGNGVV